MHVISGQNISMIFRGDTLKKHVKNHLQLPYRIGIPRSMEHRWVPTYHNKQDQKDFPGNRVKLSI